MIVPDFFHDVVDMVDEVRDGCGPARGSEEKTIDARDCDYAARCRDSLEFLVGLVSSMRRETYRVRVIGSNRVSGSVSCIERSSFSGMRDVYDHAKPVEFGNDFVSERTQGEIVGFAAATEGVVIVGKLEASQPELLPGGERLDGTFEIEALLHVIDESISIRRDRCLHVTSAIDSEEGVWIPSAALVHRGNARQVDGVIAEADPGKRLDGSGIKAGELTRTSSDTDRTIKYELIRQHIPAARPDTISASSHASLSARRSGFSRAIRRRFPYVETLLNP